MKTELDQKMWEFSCNNNVLKWFFVWQEVNESPETLKYLWYPELEIYGLETFGRQRVLKEMSGVRMGKNKTINYELGWVMFSREKYLRKIISVFVLQYPVGWCLMIILLMTTLVSSKLEAVSKE